VMPCGSSKNFRFGRTYISPILVILIIWTICSSETSVLTNVKRRHIPVDGILLLCPIMCAWRLPVFSLLPAPPIKVCPCYCYFSPLCPCSQHRPAPLRHFCGAHLVVGNIGISFKLPLNKSV
jgi:hypothetical protein